MDDMDMESPWLSLPKPKEYKPLQQDMKADAVVIGAGICGVNTAYQLAKAGKSVVLIDKDRVAGGETGYTTAFLTEIPDLTLGELSERFSDRVAKEVWVSGQAAITLIERLAKLESIGCDFERCPATLFANNVRELEELEAEHQRAKDLLLPTRLEHEGLGFKALGGIIVEDQAKFHPLKFVYGMAQACEEAGVRIFENTEVVAIEKNGGGMRVKTEKGAVDCIDVIVATHAPSEELIGREIPLQATQSYVLELVTSSRCPMEGIFFDVEHPYHYFRVDQMEDGDHIMMGGEDRPSDEQQHPDEAFARLDQFTKKIFPKLAYTKRHQWSGQLFQTKDGLPLIGRLPSHPHLLIATGFAGNGMTFGVLSSQIIRDLILEKESAWTRLYDPKRVV